MTDYCYVTRNLTYFYKYYKIIHFQFSSKYKTAYQNNATSNNQLQIEMNKSPFSIKRMKMHQFVEHEIVLLSFWFPFFI